MPTSRALLTVLAVLAALAAVGTAAAAPKDHESVAAESGGALAEPLAEPADELEGGGIVAPRGAEEAEGADAEAGPRAAQQGMEESAATPEGEEQSLQSPTAAAPAQAVEDPAYEELAGPVTETGEAGGLPSTGLELAAMATIGLGLLMLGAALRPGRSAAAGRR
jgi:hypothetical protein